MIAGPAKFRADALSRFAGWLAVGPCACTALLLVTCVAGCEHRAPGERFSAGYIFPEKESTLTHALVVKNTTDRAVEVLRIEKTCTCTSFELDRYRLGRGETAKLTLRIDVNKGYMHKTAACVLKTDHPEVKDWPYTVEFVSAPFAVAEPDALNLGRWGADSSNPNTDNAVVLNLFGDSEIALSREDFTVPGELELKLSPRREVHALQPKGWNTKYELSIRLSPKGLQNVREGSYSGIVTRTINLVSPGSKSRPWQYSVYWQALDSLEVHPSYLVFGNLLDEGDDHSGSVTITTTTNETFRVVSVNGDSDHVRMDSKFDSMEYGGRHRLTFKPRPDEFLSQIRPGESRKFASGIIQVHTTNGRKPIVQIPWSAMLESSASRRSKVPEVQTFPRSEGSTPARTLH